MPKVPEIPGMLGEEETTLFVETVKSYLRTWIHESIEPLAQALVAKYPNLAIDSDAEKIAVKLVPFAEAMLRNKYGIQINNSKLGQFLLGLGTDAIRELIAEVKTASKNLSANKPAEGGGRKAMTPIVRRLLRCTAYPGVVYFAGCPADHGNIVTVEEVTGNGGKKRREAKSSPRPDCYTIPVNVAFALMEKGGHTPSSTEEGLNAFCVCDTEVRAEIERYRAELDAKAKAAAQPPRTPIVTPEEVRAGARWVAGAIRDTGMFVGSTITSAVSGTASAVKSAVEAAPERTKRHYDNLRTADHVRAADIRKKREDRKTARAAAKAAGKVTP